MIRAVGNRRLFLTEDEFSVYKEIISVVDKNEFNNVFVTDENGFINAVFPPIQKNVSMIVIYYLFNVMLNQRIRSIDNIVSDVKELKVKIKEIEKK